jgi:ferric-dicitrate binding protein FerR (iron transport regulator)
MSNKLPWDLIVSKLRKEITSEEETTFNEWLSVGNNRQLFNQLEFVWERVQQKVSVYEPDLEYYWKELSSRIQSAPVEVQQTRTTPSYKFINRRFLRVAAAVAVIISTTFFFAYYFIGYNSSDTTQEYITYSTLSSKSRVFLPDSTEVWLHTNSSLTYNFNEKLEQREVNLSGEAFFNVKHNAKEPFIVATNGVQIKVHGTQFNVNSQATSDKVLVSLYQGSISMKTENKDILLKPGEEGLYDVNSKKISVSEGDVEFAKIWTSDKIRFENKNLREVCRYLSKWYGVEINIDPEIPDNQSYTFTFRGQSLDEVVGIMARIQSFNCTINEERNIVTINK